MGAEIIDGKQLAEALRKEIKAEAEQLTQQGIIPGLAVILVGNDPASRTYVKNKEKACHALGMKSVLIELPEDVSEQALLGHIATLNEDPDIHGILVQLPLPPHINAQKIVEAISPEKDVDGFHPINIGRMMTGQDTFYPAPPRNFKNGEVKGHPDRREACCRNRPQQYCRQTMRPAVPQ